MIDLLHIKYEFYSSKISEQIKYLPKN